jgi:hypothetical protein
VGESDFWAIFHAVAQLKTEYSAKRGRGDWGRGREMGLWRGLQWCGGGGLLPLFVLILVEQAGSFCVPIVQTIFYSPNISLSSPLQTVSTYCSTILPAVKPFYQFCTWQKILQPVLQTLEDHFNQFFKFADLFYSSVDVKQYKRWKNLWPEELPFSQFCRRQKNFSFSSMDE